VITADMYYRRVRKFSDGKKILINNYIALCTLKVHTRATKIGWRGYRRYYENGRHRWVTEEYVKHPGRIVFHLNCACRTKKPKRHIVKHYATSDDSDTPKYEGFFSCDARNRKSLWWSMKFAKNHIMDIPFTLLGIGPSEYACGAHGSDWQNKIISQLHRFFGLDAHQCCLGHDTCYTICKNKKRSCDRGFGTCLFETCENAGFLRKWTCRMAAQLSSDIVGSPLSNKAFKRAQEGCEHVKQK